MASFKLARAVDNGPRAGVLELRSGWLETPCVLISTRRGLPAHLTPDLMAQLLPRTVIDGSPPALGLHINVAHFLEHPSPEQVDAGGGAHRLLGFVPGEAYALIASLRDPAGLDVGTKPSRDGALSVQTPSGFKQLTVAKYLDAASALRPDVCVAMADDSPADAPAKRTRTAVDRTLAWLAVCTTRRPPGSLLFGYLGGGATESERQRCGDATGAFAIDGVVLGGLGAAERPSDRPKLIRASLHGVPLALPRYATGVVLPAELLALVAEGCDVLDSNYPHLLTTGGVAMTFPLRPGEAGGASSPATLNLRGAEFRTDPGPLLPGCICHTCRRHSRAYVNHLLETHEMLAYTLLDLHNNHHFQDFFCAVREAILRDEFSAYHAWFTATFSREA